MAIAENAYSVKIFSYDEYKVFGVFLLRLLKRCTNGQLSCPAARQKRYCRNVVYCRSGGNVKKLVQTAQSGRKIIAIDGCPLDCVKACLGNHSLQPDNHFELTGFGVKKRRHEDFDMQEANRVLEIIKDKITLNDKKERSIVDSREN